MIPSPQVLQRSKSSSPIRAAFSNEDVRLAWDNEVDFHVTRNLLLLRKFRAESQHQLAAAAGTSQPRIARIESGAENITLGALKKLVVALKGRFRVSISPAEIAVPHCPDWWDWIQYDHSGCKWSFHGAVVFDDGEIKKAGMAWTAPSEGDLVPVTPVQTGEMTLTLTSGTAE
jgi:hypothetical protein